MIDLLLWTYHPASGLWFGVAIAALLGGAAAYLVYALASVQYDREHRDALLKDSLREITDLSHFPLQNPNPNFKCGDEGELLYANPAAEALLAKLHLPAGAAGEILPEDYRRRIGEALGSDLPSEEVEAQRHGRTLRWRFSRFPKERAVLITGVDVTPLKALEMELRDMNETLEERVQARTLEVMLTQDVTIMSLSTLAESRDPDTGAHLERTRNYLRTLAEALKDHPRFRELLSQPGVIEQLYRSAPLHDIGKVGTRDAILLKNGRLDEDEYEVMKQHAMLGGDTLRWAEARLGTNSFLQFAREIAYYHHEKWDGSGYPFGLKGEEIPISARLMAVADVYDALRSERCYKKALSHEEARDLIAGGTGSHFDPAVVEAFLNAEDKFIAIAEEFSDAEKNQPQASELKQE
ncbi:MAG: HD domain-containing protein [Phycisphaerae bacterium]|nr:HD domain-containing protein [Phycisphaerae bacterium]